MTTDDFPALLSSLIDGDALDEAAAYDLFDAVFRGDVAPERLAAVLTALATRPVAADELVGFARAMREHAITIAPPSDAPNGVVLDNCGTGGAPRKTFNISTAAAFVLAGLDITVAKHGNRSVTRPSGSADVLERAGARLDLGPEGIEAVLGEAGIAFLFAPTFHPAMRHAGPVRAALGVKTVFNLLGPLTNPAGATHQVIGVYHPALVTPVAAALARLGCRGGMVLHGLDRDGEPGFDEATPCGPVQYALVKDGSARPVATWDPAGERVVHPAPPAAIQAVAADAAGELFANILAGVADDVRLDTVALNVAVGLVAADRAANLAAAWPMARDAVRSGVGKAKWAAFVEATQRHQ